ncbi:MAG TPA: hypothetical protein VFA63_09985 [Pseudonocardiaceae bacterium]|jgi:hypothetical protein|nr:hypothetical protein [Pseudonocardiaceae bacterium]
MESTINAPIDAAAAALATAAALPMTASSEETVALVRDLARIACHLGELTAAVRDRWAAWGTVTPHLQRAEALAADATRCLSHAAGIYVFNSTQPLTEQRAASPERIAYVTRGRRPATSTTPVEVGHGLPRRLDR